jgi:NAD(P)-dependent dehydrogenase (short-subunit alcohol dehydrogenase family)
MEESNTFPSEHDQGSAIRRILITGANKGIGLATVTAILERRDDVFILLGTRDAARIYRC